jgi:hypothetical protein
MRKTIIHISSSYLLTSRQSKPQYCILLPWANRSTAFFYHGQAANFFFRGRGPHPGSILLKPTQAAEFNEAKIAVFILA